MTQFSPTSTLYDLFHNSTVRTPNATALELGSQTYSYAFLNSQALRLASTILNCNTESPVVAFIAHKSLEAFQAVLGILAAAKGYVPLQPGFPAERTSRMLGLSGADVLIVAPEGLPKLKDIFSGIDRSFRIIPLGFEDLTELRALCADRNTIVELDHKERRAQADPSSIAYLLFTSGSTGTPKGVPIRHSNALSYFNYMLQRYDITGQDRFSQTFDMTFDLSVHDMFLCWGAGACLCPLTHTALLAPARFIRDRKLTIWFSVPSVAMVMYKLRQLTPGAFPDLRISLFCGVALSASLAAAWQAAAPNSFVENLYGPTEATIAISHYRWQPGDEAKEFVNGVVPIGNIFPDQRGRILQPDGQIAESGETGELCLAGPQLTEGYWNSPEQTAKAFIKISDSEVERWYRTGDLARMDENGVFVYLGRLDSQVQVMGYRVELQEIEHILRQAAGTEMAVAVAWPPTGGRADAIYAVCCADEVVEAKHVKEYCSSRLPGYMVPTEVLWIEKMPVNANGKINRPQLAEWVREQLNLSSAQRV